MRFLVLGPIQVLQDGRTIPIPAGKQRALLAALLVDANRSVPVDTLIERLWGHRPPATASKNLQVLVSQLRKALGEGAVATEPGGYRLRVTDTDSGEFDALLARGRGELAAGRPRDALALLDEALALWRGRSYEDVAYEDFVRDEAARLEDRRLECEEERFDALLAEGRHRDALAGLERLATEHPLDERLQAQLILALHRSGRRAETHAAYDRVRQRLSEELGIEPGERLRRLHAAILEDAGGEEAGADELRAPRAQRAVPRALLAAGALLLCAAVAAAVVVAGRGGSDDALAGVAGDHLGLVDATTGAVTAQYAVGSTPTGLVGDGRHMWVLNAGSGTISRVDTDTGETISQNPGHNPTDLAYRDGDLWVSFADHFEGESFRPGVARLDAGTLRVESEVSFRPVINSRSEVALVGMAVSADAVYLVTPDEVLRLDPTTLRVTARTRLHSRALTVEGGGLWALQDHAVIALDPSSLSPIRRVEVPTTLGLDAFAVGQGSVWAADSSGLVWRISGGLTTSVESIRVGVSALDVAFGAGAAWAVSPVDGTLARIDPRTSSVRRIEIGNAPQGVTVMGDQVAVTVAGGGGAVIAGTPVDGIDTLPASACGPVVYSGTEPPDLLIASDLPLDPQFASATEPVAQAIAYVLRQHEFRAGRFHVAYQSCDDATAQKSGYDPGKCAANAASYVAVRSVVGVVGPFNSGCAIEQIRIMNRGSVALVSPTTSYLGLTKAGPGTVSGDPGKYYPTGVRNFLRVYPADDQQAAAVALLARQLGARKVYVLSQKDDFYSQILAAGFASAAGRLGIEVIATRPPPVAKLAKFVDGLANRGVDGAFIAVTPPIDPSIPAVNGKVAFALRKRFGPELPIIVPDSFLVTESGIAPAGTYVSGAFIADPARQLPPAGRRFVREFSATQPDRVVNTFTPYAAQATEVLLAAIAASDGTRESVVRQLLRVRVRNGILGSFGFNRQGDITVNVMPIFRVPAPALQDQQWPLYSVIKVPVALVG